MNSTLSHPLQSASLFDFPIRHCPKFKPKTTKNSSFLFKSFSPIYPLRIPADVRTIRCSVVVDEVNNNRQIILPDNPGGVDDRKNGVSLVKPVAYALFYIILGVFCPLFGFRRPALAAVASAPRVAASELLIKENEEKGDKYCGYTRRLLEAVSQLVKITETTKNEGEEDFATKVKEGLKNVKMTRDVLQKEVINSLFMELKVLKAEKEELIDRSEEIADELFKVKREEENLMRIPESRGVRTEKLREGRRSLEKDYDDILGRIDEIDDLIARKETMALSVAVRELLYIEKETEAFVESFLKEMRKQKTQR